MVLIWLAVTGVGGQTFGALSDVVSNEQATFLPAEAESTRALELREAFSDDQVVPATVIASSRSGEVSDEQLTAAQQASEQIAELDVVAGVLPPEESEDAQAVQIVVLLDEQAVEEGAVTILRESVSQNLSSSQWRAHVTGPAATSEDFSEAFAGIDGLLLAVAVVAVLIILVAVYRSILLPLVVLLSSVAALCGSIIVIYYMAQAEWIQINGQAQGILSILVIGAATNYSLLFVARYREELQLQQDRFTALWTTWKRTLPPIVASGGTVAVALLCLLISDLNSNRALGPVASTGIVFAMLATLTFLPAMLALLGRPVFWPKTPRALTVDGEKLTRRQRRQKRERNRTWAAVARWVRSRPRTIWIAVTVLLVICSAGVLGLRAEGVAQSELVLGDTDTKAGQEMLEEHFDAGTGAPADIYIPAEEAESGLEIVEAASGVSEAYLVAPDGSAAEAPEDAAEEQGYVELSATLSDPADSLAAEDTIGQLRADLSDLHGQALVGGTSATQLDTNDTAQRDLVTIIPLVLAVILIFLIILLRAIVAPVVLLVTTVVSFMAALGISSVVFNHIFEFPGADPTVPLFGFMFLTALGVDYNIFLSTRAREETRERGAQEGLLHSLVVTGGVITSAGIVLATTFAALAVLPLMFMVQLAFLVAVGVLIDTFIVRTLQVPAMGVDLGSRFWWPSRLERRISAG